MAPPLHSRVGSTDLTQEACQGGVGGAVARGAHRPGILRNLGESARLLTAGAWARGTTARALVCRCQSTSIVAVNGGNQT